MDDAEDGRMSRIEDGGECHPSWIVKGCMDVWMYGWMDDDGRLDDDLKRRCC